MSKNTPSETIVTHSSDINLFEKEGFYDYNQSMYPVLEAIKKIEQLSISTCLGDSSSSSLNESNIKLNYYKQRKAFCESKFPQSRKLFQDSYDKISTSQKDTNSLIQKIMAEENQNVPVFDLCEELCQKIKKLNAEVQSSVQQFQNANLITEQFEQQGFLLQDQISLTVLIQLISDLNTYQKQVESVKQQIISNQNNQNSNQIAYQYEKNQFQNKTNEIQQNINQKDAIINQKKNLLAEQQKLQQNYTVIYAKYELHILQLDQNYIVYKDGHLPQKTIPIINRNIMISSQSDEIDHSEMENLVKSQAQNKILLEQFTQNFNIKQLEYNNQVAQTTRISQQLNVKKQQIDAQIQALQNQQEKIKNEYGVDSIQKVINIISSNNNMENIYFRVKQLISALLVCYELCSQHTAFNLEKANNIHQKMVDKKKAIEKNEAKYFLDEEIKQLIQEIFNDIQEQNNILSALSIGGQYIIEYISTCDAQDEIFKELQIENIEKISKLKEVIVEKQKQDEEKKLREEFNKHIQNISGFLITSQQEKKKLIEMKENTDKKKDEIQIQQKSLFDDNFSYYQNQE